MNVFFDLPEVQQALLLTEWLEFCDFRMFYFAVWNKQRRAELQSLISSAQCIFVSDDILSMTWNDSGIDGDKRGDSMSVAMEWCICNGVRFDSITLQIPSVESAQFRQRLLRHLSPSLETITVQTNKSHQDLVEMLQDMSRMCPKFTHVEFVRQEFGSNYSLHPQQLFETMADFLGKHAALVSVSFCGFYDIPGSFLLALSIIPSLRTVSFGERCYFGKDTVAFQYNTERNNVKTLHISKFTSVCALFPNITVLQMTDFNLKTLPLLVKYCPLVEIAVLTMSKTSQAFSEKSLRAVCRWRWISKLALEGSGITEDLLTDLVAACTTLTQLATTGYTGFGSGNTRFPKSHVGSKMMSLKTHCNRADTLRRILSLCPHLQTLSLYSNSTTNNSTSFSPLRHALHHITPECSVTTLKLIDYSDLEDADILNLQHTKLESLTIRESDKLTSQGVLTLLATLHSLRKIALIDCHEIEHNVILKMPKLCPTLRSLTYCKWVRCTCGDYRCGCGYNLEQERGEFLEQTLRVVFPQLVDIDIHI